MIGKDFYFNGDNSVNKGISIVKLNTGFTQSPFLPSKQIIEEKIKGRDKPYFLGVSRKPLQINLTLSCLDDQWTIEKRRELARWLNTDDYTEFYLTDAKYKKYYVQYVGGIDLSVQGTLQGYISVTFRCDSPYAYSEYYQEIYGCTISPATISFTNQGDADLYPEIWISKAGAGNVTISNTTYGDISDFVITGLINDETVYINNESEEIMTSLVDTYRYSNHNGVFLRLRRGVNSLLVTGACNITMRYQYRIWG